jgi:hypothetical protein
LQSLRTEDQTEQQAAWHRDPRNNSEDPEADGFESDEDSNILEELDWDTDSEPDELEPQLSLPVSVFDPEIQAL